MALSTKKKSLEDGDNNIFWVTMSDLLLGLAIIFMTLFVLAITGFSQNTLEQKQQQIAVMEPKAIAYDKFMEADGTYTTTNACKMLGLSRKKVFEVLRDKGLVYKNKTEATQKAIDRGLFKQVLKNGYPTMVITPKGIDYIKDLAI